MENDIETQLVEFFLDRLPLYEHHVSVGEAVNMALFLEQRFVVFNDFRPKRTTREMIDRLKTHAKRARYDLDVACDGTILSFVLGLPNNDYFERLALAGDIAEALGAERATMLNSLRYEAETILYRCGIKPHLSEEGALTQFLDIFWQAYGDSPAKTVSVFKNAKYAKSASTPNFKPGPASFESVKIPNS